MSDVNHTPKSLRLTAVTVPDAARLLASAYRRRITEAQVHAVVEAGELLRADGTFSLIEYVAYLAREVTGGPSD